MRGALVLINRVKAQIRLSLIRYEIKSGDETTTRPKNILHNDLAIEKDGIN